MLKQCKHTNIVAYYGTYTKQEELWIIMDYCGAGSLKDVLNLTGCTLDNEAQVITIQKKNDFFLQFF